MAVIKLGSPLGYRKKKDSPHKSGLIQNTMVVAKKGYKEIHFKVNQTPLNKRSVSRALPTNSELRQKSTKRQTCAEDCKAILSKKRQSTIKASVNEL